MDELRVAYISGVLEGEGSFFVKTGTTFPVISCEMTDLDVLEEIQKVFGGRINTIKSRNANWKESWRWTATGETAVTAMKKIRRYVGTRRSEKIDSLLAVWYSREDGRKNRLEKVQDAAEAYLRGEGSYRELSAKFDCSHESIRRRVFEID